MEAASCLQLERHGAQVYRRVISRAEWRAAMLAASDIGGMMAMMPAFANDDANDISATGTVSVEQLRAGLDRMVRDGADVIATTGSFGECHALLHVEFEVL